MTRDEFVVALERRVLGETPGTEGYEIAMEQAGYWADGVLALLRTGECAIPGFRHIGWFGGLSGGFHGDARHFGNHAGEHRNCSPVYKRELP